MLAEVEVVTTPVQIKELEVMGAVETVMQEAFPPTLKEYQAQQTQVVAAAAVLVTA